MTETVTIVGSLAGLDLRATNGARVRFSIRYAPAGGAIEGDPVDGVTLPGPEYAPSIFTGTAWASTSAAGAWGRVLPWQEGAVIAVDVPGSGVRVAVCGTGPGEVPAGATVNFVDLPGAETLVEAPSTITATVAAAVADYLAANPAGQVVSVAGRTGAVTLAKADVGLGSVDNTADAAKAFAASQITSGTVAYARLPVGTTASTVAAGDDPRFGAGSGIPATIIDAKGDLLAGTANDTVGRVAAGTNGQVLTADSSAAAGVSWQTVGGKVTSTTFPATGVFVEYPIPAAASMLELLLIGGGGGGGSGRRGATGTVRGGGGGGASGAVTRVTLEVASLTAAGITSLWVRTDIGGAGGAAVTANDTNGNAGTAGGGAYVSRTASVTATEVVAYAGGGGGGGFVAAGGAGQANFGTSSGSAGAASSATGAAGSNGATGTAGGAPSGGSGGGLTSGNAASAGGAGGDARALPSGLAAAGGTTGGGAGGNGATALGGWINVGGGGAGGGTQASGAGGAGGAGGLYGGGGGGGAAATNGASSGAGGQGGAGVVRITAW